MLHRPVQRELLQRRFLGWWWAASPPTRRWSVSFFGVIAVDVEAELAKLDRFGWRPLRPAAAEPSLRP
ncbi:hypothetical protein ACFYYP_38135 [Microbispora rosea]|uniref:hypothetical protein n=1 Tax=Microbispora rosea TaxID=58117 RepID=UPI00368AE098